MSRPFCVADRIKWSVFSGIQALREVLFRHRSHPLLRQREREGGWGNGALTVLRGTGYFWDSQNLELELEASIISRTEQGRMFSHPALAYNGYAPGVRDGDGANINSFSSWGHWVEQQLLKEKAEDGPGSGLQLLHAEHDAEGLRVPGWLGLYDKTLY